MNAETGKQNPEDKEDTDTALKPLAVTFFISKEMDVL